MKNLFSLVFILISGLSIAQVPSYVPTNGLVGWWPFNGNANDESGNGNNGTVNGATLTADRNGVANSAYSFDGGDLIQINNWDEVIGNSPFSINFWVKAQPYSGWIIAFGTSQNGQGFSCGNWHWGANQFGSQIWLYNYVSSTQTNLPDNNWNLMSIVYEANTLKTYKNGLLVHTQIVNYVTTNISSGVLNFGKQLDFNEFYTGDLDDIGFWNRALTEVEILALYEGCQLAITTQPQDQSVTTSVGVANFNVASTATNPTYQWQTNLGLGFQNISNAGQYNGATTSSLTVSNLSMSNNNQVFRCIVNDGSCVDTTAEASLIIIDDAGIQTNTLTSLKLYPNPVQDVLHIDGLAGKEFEFEVLSIDGKLLQKGKSQGEISVKELRKGNYVLRVGQQKVSFVKQ